MIEKITQSKAFISEIIEGKTIESVIVLGSGMSGFEENYKHLYQLNYSEIPNFLQPSIEGHSGKLSIVNICLLYTSPSPRDREKSRMPSSA